MEEFFETDDMKKIRKAVIPAAGYGTRFLPATKAQPKEMLPVVDKPVIQYVIEECVAGGIEDIIIVTGWHKRSIEDHFDYPFELEKYLEAAGKEEELYEVRRIASMANFIYVRQKGPYGNGTPAVCAKNIIGDENFAVLWGDEFFSANPPRLVQCLEVYEKYGNPVVAAIRIEEKALLKKYGIADVEVKDGGMLILKDLVEKPDPEKAPSNIAVQGCYILTPEIFPLLECQNIRQGEELWLPPTIGTLAKQREVNVCELKDATYYDCGNKLSYLIANIDFGMKRADIAPQLLEHMKKIIQENQTES